MGREDDLGASGLLDLRRVAMVQQSVGGEVLVHVREVHGGLQSAARPAGSGGGVDDNAGRLEAAAAHQRRQGQCGGGRIAPGGGNQIGVDEVVPEQLRKAVDEVGQQLGMVVLFAVPRWIQTGVMQREVGGQVHNLGNPLAEVRHEVL